MKILNKLMMTIVLGLIILATGVSCYCELRLSEKRAAAINAEVAVEDGGTCTVNTSDGRTITVVKNGVIQDYAFLYECGVTDAEIAQWQSASKSTVSNESTEEPNNTKSKTDGQESKQANTKESNQKAEEKKNQEPSYTAEEIAAAWVETNRVESTCTEAGHVDYSNSLTGETKSEELPLAEHKYAETERKEATCTEVGSITYTCEVCGDTYTEEVPALGHEYEWVTTKEASFFTLGEEQYVCKNCGDVSKTREISATCPIPLMGIIIGICVVLIGAVSGIVVLKKKRTIKEI
ncbi:MAG: hypothetical protein E7272_06790 [Pseudobutyrivibrio ruminis]|uniref:Ig-like domain-containing protein n=1 Tax=Pseudobutyrivibrio ruminis TaxID=46206 RepID=A0A927UCE3_9FIRM|nr:hypothetical protein [Pseudobutyrivibrio ruminis]